MLSITTGTLLCDIAEVYEILNHVTGDNLFTHVLPRAGKFARPIILAVYPELEAVSNKLDDLQDKIGNATTPESGVKLWLKSLGLPEEYTLECHKDSWLAMNPVAELESKVGKDKVIVTCAK